MKRQQSGDENGLTGGAPGRLQALQDWIFARRRLPSPPRCDSLSAGVPVESPSQGPASEARSAPPASMPPEPAPSEAAAQKGAEPPAAEDEPERQEAAGGADTPTLRFQRQLADSHTSDAWFDAQLTPPSGEWDCWSRGSKCLRELSQLQQHWLRVWIGFYPANPSPPAGPPRNGAKWQASTASATPPVQSAASQIVDKALKYITADRSAATPPPARQQDAFRLGSVSILDKASQGCCKPAAASMAAVARA